MADEDKLLSGEINIFSLKSIKNNVNNNRTSIPYFLSYDQNSDILFISIGSQLILSHASSIISSSSISSACCINSPNNIGPMILSFVHPSNPSVFFLTSITRGSIFTLQITDKNIIMEPLNDLNANHAPYPYSDKITLYECFPFGTKIFAVNSFGKLCELSEGLEIVSAPKITNTRCEKELAESLNLYLHSTHIEVPDDYKLPQNVEPQGENVPPSFWVKSEVASISQLKVESTGIDGNEILRGNTQSLSPNSRNVLVLMCDSPNKVIVGLTVSFRNEHKISLPLQVIMNKRAKNCIKDILSYSFALTEEEAMKGEPVILEIVANRKNRNIIQKLIVYTVNIEKEDNNEKLQVNWLNSKELTDYVERENSQNEMEMLLNELRSKIGNDVKNVGEEIIRNVLMIMYRKPQIADPCRMLAIQLIEKREDGVKIWAEALKTVLDDPEIDQKSIEFMWRDYRLLPQDCKNMIGPKIWKLDRIVNSNTIISAFTSN